MLAVQLDYSTHKLNVIDIPIPEPSAGQVRIKVEAAGVCLSDVHLIDGTLTFEGGDYKVILGHEVAGVIDQIGEGVTNVAIGQRVLLFTVEVKDGKILTRGVNYDGGWAEYTIANANTVLPIPDNLPFEQACFIPDAVSTPWAAISSTAQVKAGQAVGVWGIGGLGVHGVQLLHMIGAAPIIAIDPLTTVKDRALAAGADYCITPDEAYDTIMKTTEGKGLNAAFDFAGVTPVRTQALQCLAQKGKLILVGLSGKPIEITDTTNFSYNEKQILGHYGSTNEHVAQLVKLIQYERLDISRSVSKIYPLREAKAAIQHLVDKVDHPIRLILQP